MPGEHARGGRDEHGSKEYTDEAKKKRDGDTHREDACREGCAIGADLRIASPGAHEQNQTNRKHAKRDPACERVRLPGNQSNDPGAGQSRQRRNSSAAETTTCHATWTASFSRAGTFSGNETIR